MGKIVKALINLEAVAVVVDTTDVCETARQIHSLSAHRHRSAWPYADGRGDPRQRS